MPENHEMINARLMIITVTRPTASKQPARRFDMMSLVCERLRTWLKSHAQLHGGFDDDYASSLWRKSDETWAKLRQGKLTADIWVFVKEINDTGVSRGNCVLLAPFITALDRSRKRMRRDLIRALAKNGNNILRWCCGELVRCVDSVRHYLSSGKAPLS